MKAVLLTKPSPLEENPLILQQVDLPRLKEDEVLIRTEACGVCRSNLHMIEGDWIERGVPAKLPIIPGHEIVGTIEEVGSRVSQFKKGDRVGLQPLWSSCGRCSYCRTGREQLCPFKEITGETVDGGYAEFVVGKEDFLYPIPDSLSAAEAAPLFCPGITAFHAIQKAGPLVGKRVAIFGIGGVGHMAVQFACLAGATVIALSRNPKHLQIAKELGAHDCIDANDSQRLEKLKKEADIDCAVVFAPSNAVAQQAISLVKPGGKIVLGVNALLGEFSFVEEKVILGTVIGPREEMKEVLRLAAEGKIKAISQIFTLEQAPEALLKLKKGEILSRAVLVM
ncbi:zinc-dependent alcohol dehydrogenase [Methylacidiphilum kamchatkense Kam1]|uniref:alcohol dehydrogenase n=1 Tax=Methylacidiphilum kamchatkense Kam1 TaxID=1202785 RepID=A0A0C1UT74_9BACT|nr:zinc-dependent alcohol dehydrogenase family protein [Methylacidiphilum kamchatkense]KIE59013.1 zinc-dependent alcohol dehydrogenase [Methylacidiphilum kamchatkense Kam1]QDQ43093.1 propanol-preferring alcohol dehydrogenase [Methylacidiphilum kamchatkense Kam1]